MWRFVTGKPKLAKSSYTFKMEHTFKKRKEESDRLISKNKGIIPLIIEKSDHCNLNNLEKNKFLIRDTVTIGQLLLIIRKNIELDSREALFFSVGHNIPNTSNTLGEVYEHYKDDDGWLYISYAAENFFG